MNSLQQAIEHTWLPTHPLPKSDDVEDKLHQLCQEAISNQLGGVCVRPEHVMQVSKVLDQTSVRLVSVAGFPTQKVSIAEARANGWGNLSRAEKLAEAQKALTEGAHEIDWVMNATVFDREWQASPIHPDAWHDTRAEWQAALAVVTPYPLKLILETSLWSHAQIQGLCQLASSLISENPDATLFIKTCTGYLTDCQGATPEIITLIRHVLGDLYPDLIQIKASGGIKTHAQAMALLEAGATRLGTSNGLALLSPEGVLSGGY